MGNLLLLNLSGTQNKQHAFQKPLRMRMSLIKAQSFHLKILNNLFVMNKKIPQPID
jgi:hypothetical protein